MQPMNIVLALAIFLNVALIGFLLIWIYVHKLPFAKPLAVLGVILMAGLDGATKIAQQSLIVSNGIPFTLGVCIALLLVQPRRKLE